MSEAERKLCELLRAAIDEMTPNCLYCVHARGSMICTRHCTWRFEDEARAILEGGGEQCEKASQPGS